MIKLENIEKHYSKGENVTKALNGVSLEVKDGEMIAIMGRSGSGKSTLLNIIGCMDSMTSGTYMYNDMNIGEMSIGKRKKFIKDHVSFIFQDFALMDDYSVYENIELPLLVKKISKRERKKIVGKYMDMLGISELRKKYPSQLSGGEKQRTAIARAMASGNDIILADEPTGALDYENGENIISILKDINKQGKTVIIVTHDKHVAESADRIIYIQDGKEVTVDNKSEGEI